MELSTAAFLWPSSAAACPLHSSWCAQVFSGAAPHREEERGERTTDVGHDGKKRVQQQQQQRWRWRQIAQQKARDERGGGTEPKCGAFFAHPVATPVLASRPPATRVVRAQMCGRGRRTPRRVRRPDTRAPF